MSDLVVLACDAFVPAVDFFSHRVELLVHLFDRCVVVKAVMQSRLDLGLHAFALRLLQYVRDESHRFAQHYHHILRRKANLDR